ncbi:MAG TPA: hypothetical protein PKM27_05210 [Saprospiraceae bacterium]|nr:hypothetical protein [Saprospiraceae bacterium]HNT20792.1 hypothetical protein [Saprospiraceae bacterium]
MKKTYLIIASMLFLLNTVTQAQSFTPWTWDTYGLAFKAPSNMIVETNNGEEFGAKLKNDLLHLYIFPWKDAELTTGSLNAEVEALAESLGYEGSEVVELELNSFEGSYVIGKKDEVTSIILGLLDPESENNFYVLIVYGPGYEKRALEIANSFSK